MAYCKKNGKRLPTMEELLKAWEDKCTGGKTSSLCSGWYWSSKELNLTQAWAVSFREGVADFYEKSRTAPVFCKPPRKPGAQAAAAAGNKGAPGIVSGTKCASGQCNWYEAAAYCKSSGVRLYKVKEWYDLCHAECKSGKTPDNCKLWYWLGEAENANDAFSGTCDSPADASVHSVEKTSLTYARCTQPDGKMEKTPAK